MPITSWNSIFFKIKEALWLNTNHNQIGVGNGLPILAKSKCDFGNVNGINYCQYNVKEENIIAGEFRIKCVSNQMQILYSNFNKLCVNGTYFKKNQNLFLNMVYQDPNNPSILVYCVCTSNPNAVSKLTDVFILKTISVIRIGNLLYYLSSEEYKYNMQLHETLFKNNIVVPLSKREVFKFMKGDLEMLPQYINQTKIINDIINSNDTININTFVSKVLYDTGKLNNNKDKWEPSKWEDFNGYYEVFNKEIKVLLGQVGVTVDKNE